MDPDCGNSAHLPGTEGTIAHAAADARIAPGYAIRPAARPARLGTTVLPVSQSGGV